MSAAATQDGHNKQLTQNDYGELRRRKREKSTLFILRLNVLMELKLTSGLLAFFGMW